MERIENFLSLTIWVTNECNMQCTYCYEGQDKAGDRMSFDTAEAIIEWIRKYIKEKNCLFVKLRFHGGEPSINISVVKYFVEQLRNEKVVVFYSMTTNGYRISKETLQFLGENIDEISVSVDGIKEIHDRHRINAFGHGTYDEVIRFAESIKEYKCKLIIRMTISADSSRFLYNSIKELVEHGFKNITAVVDVFDENWTFDLVEELDEQCKRIKLEFKESDLDIVLPIGSGINVNNVCKGGTNSYNILPRGDIYPCPYAVEEEFCLGNIFEGIDEKKRDKICEIVHMKIEQCIGCGGYESCVSVKCKFLNKKRNGEFDMPIALLCELHRRNEIFK